MAGVQSGNTFDFGSGNFGTAVVQVDANGAPVAGTSGTTVDGNVAHDAADSGNPIKIGGKAETTAPAAVADADRVDAWFDATGRLVVALKHTDGTALSDTNGIKLAAGTQNIGDVDVLTLPALATGTNVVGRVGIDQTTPGTTNAVQVVQAALTMTHTTGSATNTTSAMLASNANRKYALLQNNGTVDVYIKIAASAVANQGIRLLANGGAYEMAAAAGNLATGAINGITASGSATVLVTEGV